MTEEEWLNCDDPELAIEPIRATCSDRKARLFGCCKRFLVWDYLVDERSQRALEISELYADGLATAEALSAAHRAGFAAVQELSDVLGADCDSYQAAAGLMWAIAADKARNLLGGLRSGDSATVLAYMRDIFGNPFRPVAFDPAWRTDTAVAVARQMYESRNFGAMPILADALQDAGCEDERILAHCRDTSAPHVRGCWVVDLVLGKT
jgi:hypothetical protein